MADLYSTIVVKMFVHEDGGQAFECSWVQGDSDQIKVSSELWDSAYEWFIPSFRPPEEGFVMKIGPYKMEYIGYSIMDETHVLNLIEKDQKSHVYQMKRNEQEWTKIN